MTRIMTRYPLPAGVISSASLSSNYTVTTSFADVPGWQIVVPANSGPIQLGIPQVIVIIVTGTNAAGTSFNLQVRVVDEATAQVALNEFKIYSSAATSQTWATGIPVLNTLPNNASQKTYRVQAVLSNVGTAGCTGTLASAAFLGTDPILHARRL